MQDPLAGLMDGSLVAPTKSDSEAWPYFSPEEVAAVVACLQSGNVNQWTGTKVVEFEAAYSRYIGRGRAVAVANGSLALELALRALKIGPGDEVIVTPRSFVASASCVALVGARPVFADVDAASGNLTPATIAHAITNRTKAVIPVHIGGWPADMPGIMQLARDRKLLVIEDCAQAHGATIQGRPVGSFGDAAAFSFCQDKIISTGGEGGLAVFADADAFEWAWSFKDHGKDRGRSTAANSDGCFRWLHDKIGTNWRMTEIAAAIGLVQLAKLDMWQAQRARNAAIWAHSLEPVRGLRVPRPGQGLKAAFYKFYFFVDCGSENDAELRDLIVDEARKVGIRVFSGSCSEIYNELAFGDLAVAALPNARRLGKTSLMTEVHPTLDPDRLSDRATALSQLVAGIIN